MDKRGKNEVSRKNLEKGKKFSTENQPSPEAKSKGWQRKKSMKDMLDYLLVKEITSQSGEKASTQEAISISLIKQALKGNIRAYEVIRDTIGEKPVEVQEVTNKTPQIVVASQGDADLIKEIQDVKIN